MMRFASLRNEWGNAMLGTGFDVILAKVSVIGQQGIGLTELVFQLA